VDDAPRKAFLLTCPSYPVHLPWYGLLLAIGLCSTLFIPIGIVQAITNQQSSLYLVCQLLCGALFPGKPVANMIFVTYGYVSHIPHSHLHQLTRS
jgi:OPT oligopeptide transporter protein